MELECLNLEVSNVALGHLRSGPGIVKRMMLCRLRGLE